MPTTPRASVNQQIQLGVETTPGTAVPANKLLIAFTWALGLKPTTKQFRGTGRQYPSASAVLTEMSSGKVSGPGDFAQLAYLFSSLWGAPTSTLVSGASTAYNGLWIPPLTGSYAASAKTYTVQVGDSSDAEQYAYLTFTGCGYSFGRKQEVSISADLLAQTFAESITLTASPTAVQQLPMTGAQFNVYLDATSANLGTTLLADPLKVDFKASDYYEGYWPINRANASFTALIDKEKKHELMLTLQANSTGIAVKGSYLEPGQRCYVRVSGVGQLIENNQTVTLGTPSAGTFTLTYKGQTTAVIAYNAAASAVKSALAALSTVPASAVNVSGSVGGPYTVNFSGSLAQDTTALTGSGAGLTGGAFALALAPVNAGMTHDMACFVSNMAEFKDEEGVYAVEYTLVVAEDTGWNAGQAQSLKLTNNLSGL